MTAGARPNATLRPSDVAFARAAMARSRLFLGLSVAGVAVAAVLTAYYGYRQWLDPAYPLGIRAVLILLILLNARQNLRQWRYGRVLQAVSATILGTDERDASSPDAPAGGGSGEPSGSS